MDENALVMLSGGLDSATCLYWAKNRFSEVSVITFNYFGRLQNEKRAAVNLAHSISIKELIEIDLPFVKEASDVYNGPLKKLDSDALWSSYVPARNMIFYSIAAHYAEYLGIKWIIGGHNLHDVQFFKDASKEYIEKLNHLFKEGCLLCKDGKPYQIVLPLAEMNRKEIVQLAIKLQIPIELTWSCHREGDVHCRQCYACKQRLEAFISLGLQDPVFSALDLSS
jgi:7-cyano-7-deazaguanine synthase